MSPPPPEPVQRDPIQRWGPLVGLGVVVVLTAVMYGTVFGGEIAGDDLSFHLAEATRMADCIRAGDWDLWNPSANAGYASAYYYQAVPQLAVAFAAAVTGTDVLFWFQLGVFLPLVLAPIAAYRALRILGTDPWGALGGAFAIVMVASNNRWGFGADGTFSVGLYTQTWALAAFPLGLAHSIRWVRDRQGLAPAIAWSGFVGVCHPFAAIAIGVAVCAGAARMAMPETRRTPEVDIVVGFGVIVLGTVLGLATPPETRMLVVVGALAVGGIRIARGLYARQRTPTPAPTAEPRLRLVPTTVRVAILGGLMLAAMASAWIPLFVDYEGFGGFPHRVSDEVGPGFGQLWNWYLKGQLLDCDGFAGRMRVMTLLLPFAIFFGRDRALSWMWWGSAAFVVLLGLGPNLPRTGDDLFPMVRFLGPLQICLALGIGAGAVSVGRALWRRSLAIDPSLQLVAQALIAGLGTAAIVAVAIPGVRIAQHRARTVDEYENIHREELRVFAHELAELPHGRRQARWGTENHWANLLPYVDARIPTTLQMGGAGLQSSPNYDYLWNEHDPARIAWVFDAPYVTMKNSEENQARLPDAETVVTTENYLARALSAPGLVSAVQVVGPPLPAERHAARKEALVWLRTKDALDDRLRPYAGTPALSAAPPADARVLEARRQESPGDAPDIVAKVSASQPTTFVVRESWHPRWRGFVDGTEVAVQRVTPDFFAVAAPPGEHVLSFRFDRPGWVWATWLLLLLAPLGVKAPRLARWARARVRAARARAPRR